MLFFFLSSSFSLYLESALNVFLSFPDVRPIPMPEVITVGGYLKAPIFCSLNDPLLLEALLIFGPLSELRVFPTVQYIYF